MAIITTPASVNDPNQQILPSDQITPVSLSIPNYPSYNPQQFNQNAVSAVLPTLGAAVTDLLQFQGNAASESASATSYDVAAQGDTAEQAAYAKAQEIGLTNANIEDISGRVQELQEQRKVQQTVGEQRAAYAANGFQESGSAIGVMQSSLQQGAISQQLIRMQTSLTEGGFLEQAAAAGGEMAAASAAANASTALAQAERTASASNTANATALTGTLATALGQISNFTGDKTLQNVTSTIAGKAPVGALGELITASSGLSGVLNPSNSPVNGTSAILAAAGPGGTDSRYLGGRPVYSVPDAYGRTTLTSNRPILQDSGQGLPVWYTTPVNGPPTSTGGLGI